MPETVNADSQERLVRHIMATRFRCVVCGKLTAGRMPRDSAGRPGDTTARFPRRHRINGKPCPGNIEDAEWVDVPNSSIERT